MFLLVQTNKNHCLINQEDYPLEHLCAMALSNITCQLFSAFDIEGVGQHDGGCGMHFNRETFKPK